MILERGTTTDDDVSSSLNRNERARLRRMHRRESSSPGGGTASDSSSSSTSEDGDTTTSYESDSDYDDDTDHSDKELTVVCDTMKNAYERYGSMLHEAFGVMHKQLSVMETVLTASAPSMFDLITDKEQEPSSLMDTSSSGSVERDTKESDRS